MSKNFGIEKFKGLLLAGSISVVIEFLMGFSDSIVAGNLLGEQALSGVNLMSPVMTLVTFFAAMVGVGMSINYSLSSGHLDQNRAWQFFTQGVWTVLMGGTALVTLLVLGRETYFGFMGASAEVADLSRAYWKYYVPSALLEPIVILLVNANYVDGDSRRCIVTYVIQVVVNVGVSVLSVKCGMGLGGCSFGTLVANVVAALILASHFFSKSNSFRLRRHFSLADTGRILAVAFGDSSSFLCSAVLFLLLNKFAIVHYGSGILPVIGVVTSTLGFLEIFNGVSTALSPIVSVYVGEGNTKAVRLMMRYAMRVSILEALALSALLAAFPGLVVGLVGISEPELVREARLAVRMVSVGFVFTSLLTLFNSYYLFIERIGLAVALTFLGGLVAQAALVPTLGLLGTKGLYAALAFAPALAMLLFAGFLRLRYGRELFPLLIPVLRDAKIRMFDLTLTEREIVDVSRAVGAVPGVPARAALMTEEVLMAVRDRNAGRVVLGEVTLDLNDGVKLTLRDDGEIFDITDSDQCVSSLRSFLVASDMERQRTKMNLVTTGFNRNVFRF